MPPHARAVSFGRGHRFAAYPRCSADLAGERSPLERGCWCDRVVPSWVLGK
jgi:hypothetical protein